MKKPTHVKCDVHNVQVPYYATGCPKCKEEAQKYRWHREHDYETEKVQHYKNILVHMTEAVRPKDHPACLCTECDVRRKIWNEFISLGCVENKLPNPYVHTRINELETENKELKKENNLLWQDIELMKKNAAAHLGSEGGKKSKRVLTPEQAKAMVEAREKKKRDKG